MFKMFIISLVMTPSVFAQVSWVNWFVAVDVARIQYAGHNDGHHIGTFNPKKFKAQTAIKDMEKIDSERECSLRVYSHTTDEVVAVFDKFVESEKPFGEFDEDIHDFMDNPESHKNLTREMLLDSENLAVYSSIMDINEENSEGCFYFNFFIYRKDGTVVRLAFNYTD